MEDILLAHMLITLRKVAYYDSPIALLTLQRLSASLHGASLHGVVYILCAELPLTALFAGRAGCQTVERRFACWFKTGEVLDS